MKNKTFTAVEITDVYLETLIDDKIYHTILNGEPDYDLGKDLKDNERNSANNITHILLESPLPSTVNEEIKQIAIDKYGINESFDINGNDNSEPRIEAFIEGFEYAQLQPKATQAEIELLSEQLKHDQNTIKEAMQYLSSLHIPTNGVDNLGNLGVGKNESLTLKQRLTFMHPKAVLPSDEENIDLDDDIRI